MSLEILEGPLRRKMSSASFDLMGSAHDVHFPVDDWIKPGEIPGDQNIDIPTADGIWHEACILKGCIGDHHESIAGSASLV